MPDTVPRILPCGDSALSVVFSDTIDEAVNLRVIALSDHLKDHSIDGVEETVPTYRALMVTYDPARIRGGALASAILGRLGTLAASARAGRRFIVPVVYGGAAGLDLEALAAMKDMTQDDLVALHSSAEYRVYMIGFAPGFAYLGGLPERLHTARLATPRQRIEAGAIGIGGRQASINSVAGPSGWRFIGRTPLRLFDPSRDTPFLLQAGDRVSFQPVGVEKGAELDEAVADGYSPEPESA